MKKSVKDKKPIQNKNVKAIKNKSLETKLNQFEIKDIYIIIFFAVITFIFFRELLLQQKFMWDDFVQYFYPVRNLAAVTLSKGILPFWNPYTFGGMPFIADPQTAVFYPLHLLLTVFVSDDKLPFVVLTYLLVFHYFMAGVFSYYLARSLNLNKWASIIGGITFMFCAFMVNLAMHETMIIQFTYMPLIFMFYHKGLNKSKLKYILLTGLFMGITILCGHPQVTLYIFFTFLLYGMYQIFFKFKGNGYKINASLVRFVAIAAVPFVIGVMLGAIQLFPSMRLAELSVRVDMSYEQTLEGSLNYHNLFTLFSPHFFGQSNAAIDVVPYWGHLGDIIPHLYWESCTIYVGLTGLVFGMLGITALWRRRIIKILAGISLFSILFILGDNFIVYKFFYNFVPGFDYFRCIGRFSIIFMFGFSLLCAYGFDYFIKNADNEKVKKFIKYFIILTIILGFILLLSWYILRFIENFVMDKYGENHLIILLRMLYKNSVYQLFVTVIILLILFGLMILYKKKLILQQVILVLFILLSYADLYIFGSQQNNGALGPEDYYGRYKELSTKIKENYNEELFRIQGKGIIDSTLLNLKFFQFNQGMVDFIFLLEGYTQLNLNDKFPPFRTNDLMNVKYTAIFDTVTEKLNLEYNENYMPRAWMSYYPVIESSLEKVAEILEDPTFDIKTKTIIDQEPEIFIDTNLINISMNQTMIKSYDINEITLSIETTENGILVLSEVYYPNWKVFVDGIEKPMLRCDYSLRGVAIEKGDHTVVFKYVDKDFQLGAVITLFALVIIVGGFIIGRYKTNKVGNLLTTENYDSTKKRGNSKKNCKR